MVTGEPKRTSATRMRSTAAASVARCPARVRPGDGRKRRSTIRSAHAAAPAAAVQATRTSARTCPSDAARPTGEAAWVSAGEVAATATPAAIQRRLGEGRREQEPASPVDGDRAGEAEPERDPGAAAVGEVERRDHHGSAQAAAIRPAIGARMRGQAERDDRAHRGQDAEAVPVADGLRQPAGVGDSADRVHAREEPPDQAVGARRW